MIFHWAGNLTVDGTETIVNTTTLSIEDNIIEVNRNVSANSGFRLPRFSLNNQYGSLDRLKMIFKTKRLPIRNLTFTDSVTNKQEIKISFQSSMNLEKINCYINQGVDLIKNITKQKVKLKLKGLKPGQRHRLNCTIMINGSIYWFGKMVKRVN